MNESDLIGVKLRMYETNGYWNFVIESIVKTCVEYYLRFSESINIKNGWLLCHRLISSFAADHGVRYSNIPSSTIFKTISTFMTGLKSRIFSIVGFSFLSDTFVIIYIALTRRLQVPSITKTKSFVLDTVCVFASNIFKCCGVWCIASNQKTHKGLKFCYGRHLRHNYKIGCSPSENPAGIETIKRLSASAARSPSQRIRKPSRD